MKINQINRPRFIFNKTQLILLGTYVITVVCIIWPITYFKFSQQQQSKYHFKYMKQSFLTPYFGILRDAHDPQWQSFRSNLLFTVLIILISSLTLLRNYLTLLGFGITLYAFRGDSILYFSFLFLWYQLTKFYCKTKLFVPICWIITIIVLYVNEMTNHFQFLSNYIQYYIPSKLSFFKNSQRLFHWAQILNMNLLKLLSFSIDYHRGDQNKQIQLHLSKCQECPSQYCGKARDLYPLVPMSYYNFFSYILFPPTFFAGPPISYKNFHSFKQKKTTKQPNYLNWILIVISFEIYQHIFPCIPPNNTQTLIMSQIISLLNLVFIWFKFLVIWRTYRVWSQMVGVQVIDNLPRCVCNNYGFEGFWRMWHRGFNHWLVRYLYIPCGGNTNYLSVIAVVCFVAFWHDHTIGIVLWALLIVAFMLPQILIKRYFRTNVSLHWCYGQNWFKYTCAIVCASYIYVIAMANLIAFGYGKQNAYLVIQKCLQNPLQLIFSILSISAACILMFYQRDRQNGSKNY